MNQPDPRLHQTISFVKSGIRIIGGLAAMLAFTDALTAVIVLAGSFVLAEVVGVFEELV